MIDRVCLFREQALGFLVAEADLVDRVSLSLERFEIAFDV
jgi:hypothetical protein